jgi:hypothetical protein
LSDGVDAVSQHGGREMPRCGEKADSAPKQTSFVAIQPNGVMASRGADLLPLSVVPAELSFPPEFATQ